MKKNRRGGDLKKIAVYWEGREFFYICLKEGINLNIDFPPLKTGLIEISRSRFKQSTFYAHPTFMCFGVFYKFLGDFWVYLVGDSSCQRISKIRRNKEC